MRNSAHCLARMPWWHTLSVLAIMTALPVGMLASPAYAQEDGPIPSDSAMSVDILAAEDDPRAAQGPNPAGCLGRTHDPHRSRHRPGTINVVADTVRCSWAVDLGIQAKLFRSRWWGWQERGDSGREARFGTSIKANAGSPRCVAETHDWLGGSYHESIQGGKKYVASTANRRNDLTC